MVLAETTPTSRSPSTSSSSSMAERSRASDEGLRASGRDLGFIWDRNLSAGFPVAGRARRPSYRGERHGRVPGRPSADPAIRLLGPPSSCRSRPSTSSSSSGSCSGSCPGRGSTRHARRPADRDVRSRTTAASPTCSSTPRARSRILAGRQGVRGRGGEMPKGMLLSGGPAPARRSSRRASPPRRTCRSSTSTPARSAACSGA